MNKFCGDHTCIHELFEMQAARDPLADAVIEESQHWSYDAINSRSNQLAHYLHSIGVGPEVRVAILMRRSVDMVVATLAIWKAGGAYVPLDANLPLHRLRTMLKTSSPSIILTHTSVATDSGVGSLLRALSDDERMMIVDVRGNSNRWSGASIENLPRAVTGITGRNLAYVIFTSGSTGQPKGVLIEHCGLSNLLLCQIEVFRINNRSRVLQCASIGFDASISEIGMALCGGAAICIAPHESPLVGSLLEKFIRRFRVTHLTVTPSALIDMPQEDELISVETLSLAGEVPSEALVRYLTKYYRVLNGYGPTEATVCSSVHQYSGDGDRASFIGVPLANTQTYILDEHAQPVPPGCVGEIYLGGIGVARGYLGDPALTAERFVPDPFASQVGARMYRTGDLACFRSHGIIEYMGRNDRQIKLRGFRIELAEIESRLLKNPEVVQAAVILREAQQNDKRLIAYVVGNHDERTPAEDEGQFARKLRSYLGSFLPDYMVPSEFIQVDRMPLNSNGKIDRLVLAKLQAPEHDRRLSEAPQGPTEIALSAIWAEVLGTSHVGRKDNFFELGGNSFLAVRILDRMLRAGLHSDVRTLYLNPTIASLALVIGRVADVRQISIENSMDIGSGHIAPENFSFVNLSSGDIDLIANAVQGGRENIQDIYPLTPLQEGFLLHHLAARANDVYRLWTMYRFQHRSQVDSYIDALQDTVNENEVLRVALAWEDLPQPVQVVLRRATLKVDELELGVYGDEIAQTLVKRFNHGDFQIDLKSAPLIRLIVVADPVGGGYVLMEVTHHMIMDHVTRGLIQEEICNRLHRLEKISPRSSPFKDFIYHLKTKVAYEKHEDFFSEMLGSVDEPTIPLGILGLQEGGAPIVEAELGIDPDLAARLRRVAQVEGVSPATLHHVALGMVLSRLTGRGDLVFGTVLSGRTHGGANTQHVMGPCANTLPIRMVIDGKSCRDVVHATHILLTQLMVHEHASLALAQRYSGVLAPAPLFSAILNYRYAGGGISASSVAHRNGAISTLPGVRFLGASERTEFPFTLYIDDWGDQLWLKVQVDSRVDPNRVCAWMTTALKNLVEVIENNPLAALPSIDILPSDERHKLLIDWSQSRTSFSDEICIHELFEASVRQFPGADAIVHHAETLSYARLNELANQLARYLRDLAVGPGRRVALCVERGFDMVIAMLAILKAGGSYVPLDPAYPTDRLEYMLRDSDPAVLLTQRKVQARVSDRLRSVATELTVPLIEMDVGQVLWANRPTSNLDRGTIGLNASHLAYIMYTSGSTGTPKGIEVEHRGAAHFIQWGQKEFGDEALRKTLFSTSINFDLSVLELFSSLAVGGTAIIVADVLSGPSADQEITLINAVPSAIKALLDARGLPPTIQTVVLAGEALHPTLVEQIFRESNARSVCNGYGPTETGYATYVTINRGDIFNGHIGRPIGKTKLYILDSRGEPTPTGVGGEIYIGGQGLARGYHRRPSLTAERFLPDIFSSEPAARMYRTGDLGSKR